MFNDLVLVHRKGGSGALISASETAFFLPTCLRQVAVGHEDDFGSMMAAGDDEVYRGSDAYRFFLEVICGLRSPLIGETEIFGQFKNAMSQLDSVATPAGLQVRRFLHALNEDAKRIRGLHLKDLGSQSYGSLLRRELKGERDLHIVGAGQLVKEILPWICKDGARVHVYARNVERARAFLKDFPYVQLRSLDDGKPITGAVVIAAPVEASFVQEWVAGGAISSVVDLRGDSHADRISIANVKFVALPELFERISQNQILLQERKDRALKDISKAVLAREQHVEYRPFGWEDVCA